MPDFVTIPFIDALEIFFGLPRDWKQGHQQFDTIAHDPNVQARLVQYRHAYHKEEERCTHFLGAIQLIINLLYPTGSRIYASAHKHVDMDVHPDDTPFGDYYPEFLSVNIQRCAWEQSEFACNPVMRGSAGLPFIWPLADDSIDNFRRRSGYWIEMEEIRSAWREYSLCYALDLLSYGPVSTHTFTFMVEDDRLHLHYYDRSLEVISTGISLVDNTSSLVALIACLGSASAEEWGILSRIKPPQPQRLSMDLYDETFFLLHSTVKCSNGATLSLGETIYRSTDIFGTGTCVVLAKTDFEAWKGHHIVLKISSQPEDQPSEGRILQATKEIAHTSSENHKWVLEHLPDVLHYEEVSFDSLQTRRRLAEYLEPLGVNYSKKSVHLFITSGLLIPAKRLCSGEDLKRVISKLIRCYKWIYEEANILHRNITVESIMYRRDSKGTIVGVLHDFSCAVFRSESQPFLYLRKRNRSTAALDLLAATKMPCLHVYRHDLESLMYVTVALACYLHASPEAKQGSRIHEWFDPKSTNRKLHDGKFAFLRTTPPPKPTQHMACLAKIIARLWKLFKNAENLQSRKKDEAWEAEDKGYDDMEEMCIKGKEGDQDNDHDSIDNEPDDEDDKVVSLGFNYNFETIDGIITWETFGQAFGLEL